jgi:hypothetical protein
MRKLFAGFVGVSACALSAGLVLGQEGEGGGDPAPVRKRQDSIALNVGAGGSGRLTLPGGDAIIPRDGAKLDTVTRIDAEGVPRTSVMLGEGGFDIEGHGGGPNIQVHGMELIPGTSGASVEIGADGSATITQTDGGPLVLRLGSGPDAMRVVVDEGAAVQLQRSNGSVSVAVPEGSAGQVHLATADGWSTLGPGASVNGGVNDATPASVAGDVQPAAQAPELPPGSPARGTEEVAASLGEGGAAVLMSSDGSTARAEAGASVVGRWAGDGDERRAVFAATEGTVHMTLRSERATGETPAHRITDGEGPVGVSASVSRDGERFDVDAEGGPATLTNELPHQGPRISAQVAPGDGLEYVASDPSEGIRYLVPDDNAEPVLFTVGTKRLRAPPGTEIQFNPDGTVSILWPDPISTGLKFSLPPSTLEGAPRIPYDGLPDLPPVPAVSRSKP